MPIGIERREYERFPCKTPILHNTSPPDTFFKGTIYNFSERGLYFESYGDLLEGHEVSISIIPPKHQPTEKPHQNFDVKIMWRRKLSASSYQVGYGAKLI